MKFIFDYKKTAELFFKGGSATPRETDLRVIEALADFIIRKDITHVTLVGHTDGTGSDAENMALSIRRADAVRDALISAGVNPEFLVTSGVGESVPAVFTADEVSEALNRRVEIVFGEFQ